MNNIPAHKHKPVTLLLLVLTGILLSVVISLGAKSYQSILEVRSLRADAAADRAKEGAFLALKELVGNTEVNQEKLSGFVVTKSSLVQFINLAEEIGGKSGATTSVISVDELGGTNEDKKELVGWHVVMRLEGAFDQVWRGVELIESLPAAKNITEVKFSKSSAANTASFWEAEVVLDVPTVK